MLNHRVPANARTLPFADTVIEACRLVVILGCTIVFALSATTFADLLRGLA